MYPLKGGPSSGLQRWIYRSVNPIKVSIKRENPSEKVIDHHEPQGT